MGLTETWKQVSHERFQLPLQAEFQFHCEWFQNKSWKTFSGKYKYCKLWKRSRCCSADSFRNVVNFQHLFRFEVGYSLLSYRYHHHNHRRIKCHEPNTFNINCLLVNFRLFWSWLKLFKSSSFIFHETLKAFALLGYVFKTSRVSLLSVTLRLYWALLAIVWINFIWLDCLLENSSLVNSIWKGGEFSLDRFWEIINWIES